MTRLRTSPAVWLLAAIAPWAHELLLVAHRIVHGGSHYIDPIRLTASTVAALEALTPLVFSSDAEPRGGGFDPVNEWTLQLLRIRHLGSAEQRLHALLSLLVRRLGRRCGEWCDLPFRLTHERIGELIGATRVTTTRMISRIRQAQLLEVPAGDSGLRLAPQLLETAPLAAV